MRMRMRIGDGEADGVEVEGWDGRGKGLAPVVEDNADGACLLSSAHKFTKISQPTDQQNKKRTLQGSYEGRQEGKREAVGVELASAVAGRALQLPRRTRTHTLAHTT